MANKRTLIVIAIVAVCVVGYFAFTGFPPTNDGAQGTIGAAQRHQTEQISSEDVAIQDAELQQLLQSDEFERLVKSGDFAAVMASVQMATLARSDEWQAAMADDKYRDAMGRFDGAFLARPDVAKAIAENDWTAVQAKYEGYAGRFDAATLKAFAESADFQGRFDAETQARYVKVLSARAEAEAKFLNDPEVQAMVGKGKYDEIAARYDETQARYATAGRFDAATLKAFAESADFQGRFDAETQARYVKVLSARAEAEAKFLNDPEVQAMVGKGKYDEIAARYDETQARYATAGRFDAATLKAFAESADFQGRFDAETQARYVKVLSARAEAEAKFLNDPEVQAMVGKGKYDEIAARYDETQARYATAGRFDAATLKAFAESADFQGRFDAETQARYVKVLSARAEAEAKFLNDPEVQAMVGKGKYDEIAARYQQAARADAGALYGARYGQALAARDDFRALSARPEWGTVMSARAMQAALTNASFREAMLNATARESLARGDISGTIK